MDENNAPENNGYNFWHNRCLNGQIGWHNLEVNPHLKSSINFFDQSGSIFIPLCGASVDIEFLLKSNFKVFGLDISEKPIQMLEAQLSSYVKNTSLNLQTADIFKYHPSETELCDYWYDRAATIALPQNLREEYYLSVHKFFKKQCKAIIVLLDYSKGLKINSEKIGPPFSVQSEKFLEGLSKNPSIQYKVSESVTIHSETDHKKLNENGVFKYKETILKLIINRRDI